MEILTKKRRNYYNEALKRLASLDDYHKGYFITGVEDGWFLMDISDCIVYATLKRDKFWGDCRNWERLPIKPLSKLRNEVK